MVNISTREGKMVSDDAREEDRVQSRSFGKLLSELGHYSKSNGKVLKSFRKKIILFLCFKQISWLCSLEVLGHLSLS